MRELNKMLVSAAVSAVAALAWGEAERPLSDLDAEDMSFIECTSEGDGWHSESGAGCDGGMAAVLSSEYGCFEVELAQTPIVCGTLSFKYRPVLVPGSQASYAELSSWLRVSCNDDMGWRENFLDDSLYFYGGAPVQDAAWKETSIDVVAVDGVPYLCIEGNRYAYGDCEHADLVLCDFKWTPAPEKIEISFDSQGAPAIDPVYAAPGDCFADVAIPTPSMPGWKFRGWYVKAQNPWSQGYYTAQRTYIETDDSAIVPFSGVTLYAEWEKPVSQLDAEGMVFSSTGNWFVTEDDDGNSRAVSDVWEYSHDVSASFVPKAVVSKMTANVTGPAFVKFGVKYAGTGYFGGEGMEILRVDAGKFNVLVDGKTYKSYTQALFSGDDVVAVPAGKHTITWEYTSATYLFKTTEGGGSTWDGERGEYVEVEGDTAYVAMIYGYAEVCNIEYEKGGPAESISEWVRRAKDYKNWNTGDFARFAAIYDARIKADAADYEARIMHAAMLLARLSESKTVSDYAKKFGFTIDYFGMKVNGTLAKPGSFPSVNTMVDAFVKEALPEMLAAHNDLSAIPSDWAGLVRLSADEYPVDEDTVIDIGDVLYARAGLEAAIGTALFAHGYDLTVDFAKAQTALDYRRAIPVAKTAPSMTTEDGWEVALSNGKAKMIIGGKQLFLRVTPGTGADSDGVSSGFVSVVLANLKKSGVMYMLTASIDQGSGICDATLIKTGDGKMLVVEPTTLCEEDPENGVWTFSVDLSNLSEMATAGTLSVYQGNALIYHWFDDSYDEMEWCDDVVITIDNTAARVGKFINDQTKFMAKVRNQSSLSQSRTWMSKAFGTALAADAVVQGRTDDLMHFIEYDPEDAANIARARDLTEKALAALSNAQEVDVQDEVLDGRNVNFDFTLLPTDGVMRIYLGALFEGKITRDLLPTFLKGVDEGPVPVMETIKDPTIAGLLPEFTVKSWSRIANDVGIAVAHQAVAVKLDANGGKTAAKSVALGYDEENDGCLYPQLPVPTKAGSIFVGWATAKTGGDIVREGEVYDAGAFAGAKAPTLYAQWLTTYALTVKGEGASAKWGWSDEQADTLPPEVLDGEYPFEVGKNGVVNVPAGAVVNIYADGSTFDKKNNELVFQKWSVSSSKADLGAEFLAWSNKTSLIMPPEKLAMTATYIDESTCGWLSAEAWANEVYLGWDDDLGEEVVIAPPYAAFEWSPDGGKTWYKSGDAAMLKAGAYTVSWRSTDANWSAPTIKEKVAVVAGDCASTTCASFFFSYVPELVVDVMTCVGGEPVMSYAGGSVSMNPKDGKVPVGKSSTLTAKSSKGYAFQGWAFAKDWQYGKGFYETAATWKMDELCLLSSGYPATSGLLRYIDPADLKVHVVAVFKAVSAYAADDIAFDGISGGMDAEAQYDGAGNASVDVYGVVGCEIGGGEGIWVDCAPKASPLTFKLDGKLPAGIKFDAKKGVFSGVPAKEGNTVVAVVVIDPAKNSKKLTVNIHVKALPAWLVGEFRALSCENSMYCDEAQPGVPNGLLELSVAAAGKVSAKFLHRGGSTAWSGSLFWRPDGNDFSAEGQFCFSKSDSKGDVYAEIADGSIDGWVDAVFKDGKAEELVSGTIEGLHQDTGLLKDSRFLDKYYTFAFSADAEAGEETMKSGYGYLTIKTDKKGAAKVTGQLPDGEKVSMSALVMPFALETTEGIGARLYLFASPSSYKKQDWFAMTLVIAPDGYVFSEYGAAWTPANGYSIDEYGMYKAKDAQVFGRGALYSGANSLDGYYWNALCANNGNVWQEYSWKESYYDEDLGRLVTYTAIDHANALNFDGCFFNVLVKGDKKGAISLEEKSPAPWVKGGEWNFWEDKKGKEITDPSQLSISFTKATGIFTGKASVYFEEPKPMSASLPYAGVMIDNGDGGYMGLGSAVYNCKYSYSDSSGKIKSNTKKVTLPVSLDLVAMPDGD